MSPELGMSAVCGTLNLRLAAWADPLLRLFELGGELDQRCFVAVAPTEHHADWQAFAIPMEWDRDRRFVLCGELRTSPESAIRHTHVRAALRFPGIRVNRSPPRSARLVSRPVLDDHGIGTPTTGAFACENSQLPSTFVAMPSNPK
jgi:hypothetical protein